jgi:hypothetical protein
VKALPFQNTRNVAKVNRSVRILQKEIQGDAQHSYAPYLLFFGDLSQVSFLLLMEFPDSPTSATLWRFLSLCRGESITLLIAQILSAD